MPYSNRYRLFLLLFVAHQWTLNDLKRMFTSQQCFRSLDFLQCIEALFEDRSSLLLLKNEHWSLVNRSWAPTELCVPFFPHRACGWSMNVRHPVKVCANRKWKQCRTDRFFDSLPKDCYSNCVEDLVSMVVASVSQETVHVRHSNQSSLTAVHLAVDENPLGKKQRRWERRDGTRFSHEENIAGRCSMLFVYRVRWMMLTRESRTSF